MMTERLRSASTTGGGSPPNAKMESDLSPRKTMVVLVIVVGCFAVLWPKVFYPMLLGSANQHMKPSPIDKTTGCCDVISEIDVNTIKIMSELCGSIIKDGADDKPLSGKEIVKRCQKEILDTCGIDISALLQDQVRLSQNVKQILEEVRSLNGSLCLKYHFGVAPWRLGVPHRVTVKIAESNIRQERPLHLRSELIHPAFRERGRAIPQPQTVIPSRPPPRIVEGRPGPVPGMRPTIGGAGHVVPPPKQGTSSMSVIMPIYTIGIVVFFTYTLMKIIFKKQPDGVGGSLYPPVEPDPYFRKEVFESEKSRLASRLTRENVSSKLVVNAMSALLDEVDQEIEARRNKSNEITSQDLSNGNISNGDAHKPHDEDQPTVTVLGMEMQASCEGGKKWTTRADSPVLLPTPVASKETSPAPQEIYLEGSLPAQSHLLVSDSATEPEINPEDPAIVLAGKMTLSVISLDSSENGEANNTGVVKIEEPAASIAALTDELLKSEAEPILKQVEEIIKQSEDEIKPVVVSMMDEAVNVVEDPIVKFQDVPQNEEPIVKFTENEDDDEEIEEIEVEELEQEVDDLIQEAVENVEERQNTSQHLDELREQQNQLDLDNQATGQSDTNQAGQEKESSPIESLKSDEEIEVEIQYGSSEEEEVEVEEEEEEEDVETDKKEPRLNGVRGPVGGSKDTTFRTSETAAENDVSEGELSEEEMEEDEEVIEVDEDDDEEEEDEIDDPTNNINHVTEDSEHED